MAIIQLPPHLINQISAGEVLTRPSSAVKELLENSLDANASFIEVTINGGGLDLIQIKDNGDGISFNELPLAIAPHATSKLACFDDLSHLKSFGFRGEALASLAAVSKLTVTSKTVSAECGYAIEHSDGETTGLLPAAHPNGTTIQAKNLFYNIPVRRKFLRSARSEWAAILNVCQIIALQHPEVEFLVKNDGRHVLHCPKLTIGPNALFERMVQIFKLRAHPMINVSNRVLQDKENLSIFGWIFSDLSPQKRLFFVNRRPVKNPMLQQALKAAISESPSKELFENFSFVFFINLPAQDLDVNVHPNKEEVRFRDPLKVHRALFSSVRCEIIRFITNQNHPHDKNNEETSETTHYQVSKELNLDNKFFNLDTSPDNSASAQASGLFYHIKTEEGTASLHQENNFSCFLSKKVLQNVEDNLHSSPESSIVLGDFIGTYKQFIIFKNQDNLQAYDLKNIFNVWAVAMLRKGTSTALEIPRLCPISVSEDLKVKKNLFELGFFYRQHDEHVLLLKVPEILKDINWKKHWTFFLEQAFSSAEKNFKGWEAAISLFLDELTLEIKKDLLAWINQFAMTPFDEQDKMRIYRDRHSFCLNAWLDF